MSMDVSGSSATAKSDINITPLVDILLVLLVIFMVMTPLLVTGIQVIIPAEANTNEAVEIMKNDEKPYILTIKKDGTIFLNSDVVDGGLDALPLKIQTLYQARRDKSAFFQADGKARYEMVVAVVDILSRYGVETIGMMIIDAPIKQ